jgi:CDP-diacylglycerol---glycerol-3-phosphate 3-phosphatidyltransferase
MTPATVIDGTVIALFAFAGICGVLAAYSVRAALIGRVASSRLDTVRGTPLLGRFPIEAFHWAAWGLGRTLSRTGVSPDALTLSSLALTFVTMPLAATGRFEAAGVVLLIGSAFDALDGIVARERKMASDAGEIFDSVLDRYADAFCLAGLGLFYRESPWSLSIVFVALVGSMMVSYVRAKTEKFGLSLPSTLMRRPERIAYLAGALLLGPTLSSWLFPSYPDHPVTLAIVGLVALISNVSALQLLTSARRELRRRSI